MRFYPAIFWGLVGLGLGLSIWGFKTNLNYSSRLVVLGGILIGFGLSYLF